MEILCYCNSTASLKSNALIYNGKEYGNGRAWICDTFPECRGSVGSHPDGRPLGTIPDPETKQWRIKAHAVIDPLWKSKKYKRSTVYARLSDAFGEEIHVGKADKKRCEEIIKTVPLIFNR